MDYLPVPSHSRNPELPSELPPQWYSFEQQLPDTTPDRTEVDWARLQFSVGAYALEVAAGLGLSETASAEFARSMLRKAVTDAHGEPAQELLRGLYAVVGTSPQEISVTNPPELEEIPAATVTGVTTFKQHPRRSQPSGRSVIMSKRRRLADTMPYIAPEKDLSDEQIIDLFMPADEGERSAYIRNLCQEVQASCRAQRAANPQLDHALMDQTARGVVLLRKTYNHYRKIDNREPSIMADMQYALGAYVKRIEPYVHVIARQLEHANSAHTREDLVSEGQMGLLEALGRFDLGWETRFISYASRRIHGAMVDATRNTGSVIRTGRSDIRRVSQYYELTNQGKSLEEAASSLGLTASALEQLTAHHTNTNKLASLDAPTAAEGLEIGDMVPDGSQDVEWEAIGPDMAANDVRHLVAQLPEREAKIVSQYFGLPPYAQSCMLAEIAEELGVSESRISRIVNHSVKRMHGMLPSGMLYRRYSSVRGAEDVG